MDNQKRKTLKSSTLEKIPGIGPAKAKLLLRHFGTLGGVRSADAEALSAVKGISEADVLRIVSYFTEEK